MVFSPETDSRVSVLDFFEEQLKKRRRKSISRNILEAPGD